MIRCHKFITFYLNQFELMVGRLKINNKCFLFFQGNTHTYYFCPIVFLDLQGISGPIFKATIKKSTLPLFSDWIFQSPSPKRNCSLKHPHILLRLRNIIKASFKMTVTDDILIFLFLWTEFSSIVPFGIFLVYHFFRETVRLEISHVSSNCNLKF